MHRAPFALSVFVLAGLAPAAYAHHSISGVYDSARQVTVEGTVREFRFVNPHPVLVVDAAAEAGRAETWQLEMDNRNELVEVGMSAETFKAGDRVVASGSAARREARRLYLLRLDRPADGFRYEQIGFRPRIEQRAAEGAGADAAGAAGAPLDP
ncbi:MAG TPA: DUF6152 family protein [Gammaproteobacteria bacterium]|nr:DUF6152 family protein [Gammaproteobacteria bacterium]